MLGEAVTTSFLFVLLARRHGAITAREQWNELRPVAVGGGVAWVGGRLVLHVGVVPQISAAGLCASVAAVLVTYAATVAVLRPRMFAELLRLGRRALARAEPGDPLTSA
ncbi:MAG: hypothetical protein LC792_12730, partial [Actinobacteria bacterium]|nr:hypothetical protein [Actinomycetota bacterium]